MCGIYGSNKSYSIEGFEAKMKRASFRGPDFTGLRQYDLGDGRLTLGHNRLAIIDLDSRSNQPFDYYDKVSITFNGEIFNFQEIRKELADKGYNFKTESDTEVICASYLEYGENCVLRFIGMFAFVIFDHRMRSLFGARDRLGQKPFYYQLNSEGFEFASQISMISTYNKSLTLSEYSIKQYLSWNSVPDPFSIYEEVKKLKPGHCFNYNLDSGDLTVKEYWNPTGFVSLNSDQLSYEEAKKQMLRAIKSSVEYRMISDVPLGVFLSGGVDSSLIASVAQSQSSKKVKSFSVKFSSQEFDESEYAKEVALQLGTDHHTIECDYREGLSFIDDFHLYYDEPFADSSAIPSLLLSKYTRKHVTVALSGDGGDESFLGYHRYRWIDKAKSLFYLPYAIRKSIGASLQMAPNYRLRTIGKGLMLPSVDHAYLSTLTNIDNSYIDHPEPFKSISEVDNLFNSNKNLLERSSDFDLQSYLNWDINTKVDRASMAFSLEVRAPLMDHRVVELAQSLPTEYKYHKSGQKRILKDLLYQFLPKELFDRRKAGFAIPFKDWFRNEMKEMVLDELSYDNLREIPGTNATVASKMIEQHMKGEWNRTPVIWKLLILKKWIKANA